MIAYFIVYIVLLKFVYFVWRFVFEYFLASKFGFTPNLKGLGEWAVITGATDGIGKEYSKELARKGFNIVIIGRSQDKLDATEIEIKDSVLGGKCDVKQIKADFSHVDGLYESIRRQLTGLNIGILVNNVGVSYTYPERFMSYKGVERLSTDIVNVNSLSAVRMTEIVMRDMLETGKGAIINVSSFSGAKYSPMFAVYSASKAFVTFFSNCLSAEYRNTGVIIQCLTPLFICTKMSGLRRPSLFAPLPQTYVKSSLATLGQSPVSYGYWPHAVQGSLLSLLPDFLWSRLSVLVTSRIKAAYLKKMAKKQ